MHGTHRPTVQKHEHSIVGLRRAPARLGTVRESHLNLVKGASPGSPATSTSTRLEVGLLTVIAVQRCASRFGLAMTSGRLPLRSLDFNR